MTKCIRVENADMSSYKVVVEVWDKGSEGKADSLQQTVPLDHPTALAQVYIHSHRYLVVKEAPSHG